MAVSQEVAKRVVTAGAAYWNQRFTLAESRERIEQLVDAVGHANEFAPYQWAQLTALALEFQPDCIIEIGNGWGNSTCAFLDAANQIGPHACRVISLDHRTATDHLQWRTAVAPVVPDGWLDALESKVARYDDFDYEAIIGNAERVLVLWAASGFEVAECVLGLLLPHLANRQHLVAMHGISDGQFQGPEHSQYGDRKLWTGSASGGRLRLGPIDSAVEQALAIVDFSTRNGVDLTSADDSFHQEIALHDGRTDEMRNLLGERLFSLQGHWYWFTLNDSPGPCTFPGVPQSGDVSRAVTPNEPYRSAYKSWNVAPQFEAVDSDRLSAPAAALWKHRQAVSDTRTRFQTICSALGTADDVSIGRLSQWFASAVEFAPDLILEIGRGAGDATCAFTEAANRIGATRCRVVSVGESSAWESHRESIAKLVGEEWFQPLSTLTGPVGEFDYASILGDARRVMVFWRAESYESAACVLGEILPLIADFAHVVILPNLWDARYLGAEHGDYSGRRIWQGNNDSGSRIRIGRIDSSAEQAIAVVDFAGRNELRLYSADESIQGELTCGISRLAELRDRYGFDSTAFEARWFWFTMNGHEGPLTFPKFEKPEPQSSPQPVATSAPTVEEVKPAPASEPTGLQSAPVPATPRAMGFAAASLWNHRGVMTARLARLRGLHKAVGHTSDMALYQFLELFAAALEYKPDLILELGRGKGNSTCAFTEAANVLGAESCRVVSLCNSKSWEPVRPPEISSVVPAEWFKPLRTHSGNILDFDYQSLLAGAKRVLVFWDAHGFDIAECVLGRILPLLANREHLVIMHDLSDSRYVAAESAQYGDHPLWRGNLTPGARVRLGNIDSAVEQSVAILDFASRNKLELHSADESIQNDIVADQQKLSELRELLGSDVFSPQAHWFYFSLNEHPSPYTFPKPRQRSAFERLIGTEGFGHHAFQRLRRAAARLLPREK